MNYRTHYLLHQEYSSAYIDANHERESVKVAQLNINCLYEYRSLSNVQPYITIPTSLFIKYPTSLCQSVLACSMAQFATCAFTGTVYDRRGCNFFL